MNTPPYEVKPVAEGTWAGIGVSVGTLLGAILTHYGVDNMIIVPAVALAATLTRQIGGVLLAYVGKRWPPPTDPPAVP